MGQWIESNALKEAKVTIIMGRNTPVNTVLLKVVVYVENLWDYLKAMF